MTKSMIHPKSSRLGQYIVKLSEFESIIYGTKMPQNSTNISYEIAQLSQAINNPNYDKLVNTKHFRGRISDIQQVIKGQFLTASDIAKDLHINVRRAHSFLSKNDRSYRHIYHIKYTVKIHGIDCDVKAPEWSYQHHGYLGKQRCTIIVSEHEYSNFINYIYSPMYSSLEQKLIKEYRNAPRISMMKEILRLARKVQSLYGSNKKYMPNNIIRSNENQLYHKVPSKLVNKLNSKKSI